MKAARRISRGPLVILSAAVCVLLAACGGVASRPGASHPADAVTGKLTVLAAASLTDAFNREGLRFKAEHPGVEVVFSYAGSQTLVTQIQQGAPADLFASADQSNMQKVVSAGLNSEPPRVFARNKLQIVVQRGNPKQIKGLADLATSGTTVDTCAPAVPCGAYAATALTRAKLRVTPVSQEDNVKAVVTRVSLGEADAGIVYATDVKAGGARVQGVDIPDDQNVVASYPIVELRVANNAVAAKAFTDFVMGAQGQRTLAEFGFLSP